MSVKIHDPNELKPVTMTPKAIKHTQNRLTKENKKYFRLSLKEAGCSGMQYIPELVDDINADDYCFEGDIAIYVDKESYPYLKGTQIDFVKEGLNEIFKYNNPNEKGACGCGESIIV